MSKSVDETVFDYFTLLLSEPTEKLIEQKDVPQTNARPSLAEHELIKPVTSTKSAVISKKSTEHLVAPQVDARPNETRRFAEPTTSIDKAALTKLLSAVSDPEPQTQVEAKVEAKIDAVKNSISVDEIKASANKVRQAIIGKANEAPKQTAVDIVNTHKTTQANKEINSLADKKLSETAPNSIKKAIIDHKPDVDDSDTLALQTQLGATPPSITHDLQQVLDNEFQVLFFKVAGLTLAVPLVSLGGIVKVERISHLIGRPKWFLGVQTHREEKINVVDTGAWVMPEKYTPQLAESIDYQYLVMLEDSRWGLACESLVNAVKIDKSHVNWREKSGKRPWLAGVVKQQMCGILHVQALIKMLDAGLGCQDSIDRG
ncbi:chemotaxis protein CheW [Shewanella aestuarii]|uniref:Chemotaxis protein CheW n=1 Tax=Shewanella aestuarii TaxID=1028752 RepID=A0A6G9QIW5_9GAMM|nr:chemotaxis protein CheW [Shewanella aestuarii]QIR14005.1 chemotaxis protein CheW [Shewanella aestuarii]